MLCSCSNMQSTCVELPFDCDTNIEAKATNGTFALTVIVVCTEQLLNCS